MTKSEGEARAAGPVVARAHWSIYLPSLAVALLWGLFYAKAQFGSPQLPAIAALCLVVEAVGVPLLLFLAWGRSRRLMALWSAGDLVLQSGFPLRREWRLAPDKIESIRVSRGPLQCLVGGGALRVSLKSGEKIVINDLDRAGDVVALFSQVP